MGQLVLGVHRRHLDGSSAAVGATVDVDSVPLELIVPLLDSRIEEFNDLARFRIDTRKAWTFVKVAVDAG